MAVRWFNDRQTVRDLARGDVSAREQALYFIGGWIAWLAPYYLLNLYYLTDSVPWVIPGASLTTWASPSVVGLWMYEAIVLFVITYYGVMRAFQLGSQDKRFLTDFVCILFPTSAKVLAIAWSCYVVGALAFGYFILKVQPDTLARWSFSPIYLYLGDLVRFLTTALAEAIVLLRVGSLMRELGILRTSSNSLLNADARDEAARAG